MYVYWQSEPGLFTVGFYKPDGTREPESDHDSRDEAADRVHYLNGGKEAVTSGPLNQPTRYVPDPRD